MKIRKLGVRVSSFINRHKREMEFMALGVFLAGVGVLASLILSKSDNQGIEIIETGQEDLLADVAGAVIHPGVYRLPPNSRFADALAAAGGLSAAADRDWVSRHLNLAQNISDGIKIYIPATGESNIAGQKSDSRDPKGSDLSKDLILSSRIININSASLTDLDTLWGVGEARAKAIIEGRPYGSVEELVTRKIVPSNVVEKNRDRLQL